MAAPSKSVTLESNLCPARAEACGVESSRHRPPDRGQARRRQARRSRRTRRSTNPLIAKCRARQRRRHRPSRGGRESRVQALGRLGAGQAARGDAQDRRRDRGARRRHRAAGMLGHGPGLSLHVARRRCGALKTSASSPIASPAPATAQNLPSADHWNVTTRVPIGPVGVITPWNTPFMLSTWKIAPALAAGCTVVHKPAEWSPATADMLVRICLEAGLPAGRVQHRAWHRRGGRQSADRASRHQGDRLRRRELRPARRSCARARKR